MVRDPHPSHDHISIHREQFIYLRRKLFPAFDYYSDDTYSFFIHFLPVLGFRGNPYYRLLLFYVNQSPLNGFSSFVRHILAPLDIVRVQQCVRFVPQGFLQEIAVKVLDGLVFMGLAFLLDRSIVLIERPGT